MIAFFATVMLLSSILYQLLHTEKEEKPLVPIAQRAKCHDLGVTMAEHTKVYKTLSMKLEKSKQTKKVATTSNKKKQQSKSSKTTPNNNQSYRDSEKKRERNQRKSGDSTTKKSPKHNDTSGGDITKPISQEPVREEPQKQILELQVELIFIEIGLRI